MSPAQKWGYGLLSTVINGVASGVVLIVVDPVSFNVFEGWQKLLTASLLLGLLGAANYLKASPLPNYGVVLLPLLLLGGLSAGCGARGVHIAAVSVATAHTTLAVTQDTALKVKCGEPTAPAAPACLSTVKPAADKDSPNAAVHRVLAKAFELDGKVATAVRDWPVGAPMPLEVPTYLAQITQLVKQVVDALPASAFKTQLLQKLGAK